MARPASRIAGARIDYDLQNQTTFNHNHNWQGESSTGAGDGVSYGTGDIVIYNGHLYISLVDNNENNTPAGVTDANWRLLTTDATGNFSIPTWASGTSYAEGTLVQHTYMTGTAPNQVTVTRLFESLRAIIPTDTAQPQTVPDVWADIAAAAAGTVTTLGGLSDVTFGSALRADEVLTYNGTTWTNTNLTASLDFVDISRDTTATPVEIDLTAETFGETIDINRALNLAASRGIWNVPLPASTSPVTSERTVTLRALDPEGRGPDVAPYISNPQTLTFGQFNFSLDLDGYRDLTLNLTGVQFPANIVNLTDVDPVNTPGLQYTNMSTTVGQDQVIFHNNSTTISYTITIGTDSPFTVAPGAVSAEQNFVNADAVRINSRQIVTDTVASEALRNGVTGVYFGGSALFTSTRRAFIDGIAEMMRRGIADSGNAFVDADGNAVSNYSIVAHHYPRYSEIVIHDASSTQVGDGIQLTISNFDVGDGQYGGLDPQFGPGGTSIRGLYPKGPGSSSGQAEIEIIEQDAFGNDINELPVRVDITQTETATTLSADFIQELAATDAAGQPLYDGYTAEFRTATSTLVLSGPIGVPFRVLSGFPGISNASLSPTESGTAQAVADFKVRPTLNGAPLPLDVSDFPGNAILRVNERSTNLEVAPPNALFDFTQFANVVFNDQAGVVNVLRPVTDPLQLNQNINADLVPEIDVINITTDGRPHLFIRYNDDTRALDGANPPALSTFPETIQFLEGLVNNPTQSALVSLTNQDNDEGNRFALIRHGSTSLPVRRFAPTGTTYSAAVTLDSGTGAITLTNIRSSTGGAALSPVTNGTVIPAATAFFDSDARQTTATEFQTLVPMTVTNDQVIYSSTQYLVEEGSISTSLTGVNYASRSPGSAETVYAIGIDTLFDRVSGVPAVYPVNNVQVTVGEARRLDSFVQTVNGILPDNAGNIEIPEVTPFAESDLPTSAGDYVLNIDANNTASWTEDQDIMVQSGAVDVNTRELNLYYGSTATGSPDVSIDISNLGTHDSFGLHIAGARDYDVSSVTRTVGSTSLVTVAFDSETTRNDFFRHVLGTTSTAARIGTTLNFESHTGTDPDGDDTPIATFALSPGGFFSAGNNSNEVILDPDTIAEGNAFIDAFNTATHTTLSSGDNTLRWENSATVTQLVGNDDITPLISTDGSSFTLNLPDEGVGGTVMRTSAFPNTGAERTANNTPINVHKAYNFTTLAAGTDDLGAPTSEVITLRVNNRTIEAPADGQLSVGGSPIVTRTDLENWSGIQNYRINDEIVFQSSLYRARLDVTGDTGIRNDVGGVIDARFADVNGVSTLIIDFDGAPLIPLTVTPPGVSNYSVQFAVEGTPTVVRFNGTHVTRDTTTNTWNVARSDTHYNATVSPPLQGQVPDGFRSDRASTWVYESNNLATPPLNPGLNTADWERLSNPFGGDSSGSIPEWEAGGTITEGQLYYYSGALYRSHSTIHGAGNQTTPNVSTDFDKIGEIIAQSASLGGLEFFPYGSMILDNSAGNVGEVWMQINSTAQPYDPSNANWVNLNTQTFTRLADTPSALGTPGQNLQVNAAGTGLEFVDSTSPAGRTLLHDWDEEHAYTTDEEVVYNSAIYRARMDVTPSAAGGTEIIGITQMTLHEEFFEIGFDADHPPVAGTTYHVTFTDPITNIKHLISFDGANIINNTNTNNAGPGDTVDGSDRRWFVLYSNGTPNLMSVVGYQGAHVAVTTVRVYTGSNPDTDIPITHASHFANDIPRTSGFNNPAVPVLRIEFDLNNPVTPLADTVYTYSFSYQGTARAVTFNGNDVNRAFTDSDTPSNFNWFIRRSDLTGVPAGLPLDFYPDQSSTHLRASSHESNNNPGLDTDNWERLSDPRDAFAITVWEERTGYVIGDVVVYEGELFRALVVIPDETGNTAVNPNPTDAADWQQLSYKETEAEPFRTEDLPSTDGNYVMNRDTVPASHSIIDMGEWFGQAENVGIGQRDVGFRRVTAGDRIDLHYDNADSQSQETQIRTVTAGDTITITYPDPDNNNAPVAIVDNAVIRTVTFFSTFAEILLDLNTYTLPTNPALYDAVRLSVSIGTFTPEATNYIWTPQPQGVLGYRRWYMQNLRSDVGSDQTIRPVINQGPALADLTDNAQFGGALPNFQCSAVPGHTDVYAFTPSTNQTLPPGLYQVEFKLDTPNAVEVDMLELLPGSTANTFTIPQSRFSIAAGTVGSAGQLSLSATLPMFTPAAGGRLAGAVGFIFRRVASGGPAFTDGLLTLTRLA